MKKGLKTPLIQQKQEQSQKQVNNHLIKLEQGGCLGSLVFSWINPLVKKGYKTTFQQDMYDELPDQDKPDNLYQQLQRNWNKFQRKSRPLLKSIWSTFKFRIILALILQFSFEMIQFSLPLIIRRVIKFQNTSSNTIQVLYQIGYIFFSKILMVFLESQSQFKMKKIGINMVNALSMIIYSKSLKFSVMNNKQFSIGKLVNLMQVDVNKIQNMADQVAGSLFIPIRIAVGLLLMYDLVGLHFLSGIIVLAFLSIFNYYSIKIFVKNQADITRKGDNRLKTTNEILNGIKFIKMCAWENVFIKKLESLRDQELKCFKKLLYLRVLQIHMNWLLPVVVILSVFSTYIYYGNQLTIEISLTFTATFQILQNPIQFFSRYLTYLAEALVSIRRIENFLKCQELKLFQYESNMQQQLNNSTTDKQMESEEQQVAINIKGDYYWIQNNEENSEEQKTKEKKTKKINQNKSKQQSENGLRDNKSILQNQATQSIILAEEFSSTQNNSDFCHLKNIDLQVLKGQFVVIIGPVGAGKSSLLYSLLGEMSSPSNCETSVIINGSMSIVPQRPWIQNATLRDNILFGNEYNESKYNKIIDLCCLRDDLAVLPKGDLSEIGEKGLNLSGGQKARVALARAAYSDCDILLLDDSLSAVDVHVGRNIFHNLLKDYLKDKTIILVTHALQYIKYVDLIYIMDQGVIIKQGIYEEIIATDIYAKIIVNLEDIDQPNSEDIIPESNQQAYQIKNQLNNKDNQKQMLKDKNNESLVNQNIVQQNNEVQQKEQNQKIEVKDDDLNQIVQEDRKSGMITYKDFLNFFRYNGGYCFMIIVVIVMLLWIGIRSLSDLYLLYWCEHWQEEHKYQSLQILWIMSVTHTFMVFIRVTILFWRGLITSKKLHNSMIKQLLFAPINTFFDRVPTGRILNRLSKDLQLVDADFPIMLGGFTVTVLLFAQSVTISLYGGSYYIAPVIILSLIAAKSLNKYYLKTYTEIVRLDSITKSPVLSLFSETLNGATTIRANNKEQYFLEKQLKNNNEKTKNEIALTGLLVWYLQRINFLSILTLIMPTIVICFIWRNNFSTGFIALLVSYCFNMDSNLISAINGYNQLSGRLVAFERCIYFTQLKQEKPYLTNQGVKGYTSEWPQHGQITFNNLCLRYRPNLPLVLQSLSFSIDGGCKVGIVGRTGAGKSSIILALLRIVEADSGNIEIDGVNTSELGLQELRSKITIIPQDSYVFEGTLRTNLDPLTQYKDEQLWDVLDKVKLKETFMNRQGLNSELSENGDSISVGEKQLLCIARAILKKSRIILLDEATSNIDVVTEKIIQDSMNEQFKEQTVITIAHRLNTIINYDKIIVLDQGKVVEYDTPQNLLNNPSSYFSKLWAESNKENI